MPNSVPSSASRTPEKSVRNASRQVRAGSHALRIGAKELCLLALNEARTAAGLSIEAMAINAGVPVSSMSDALAGKDGRNFAAPWLLAQGDDFVRRFNAVVNRELGLTPESVDEQEAAQIGALLTAIVNRAFRARRAVNE